MGTPGPADPSRGWDAGTSAAVGPPSSPALTFAIGMGLMLSVPLLLALAVASCWRRCQKQLTTRRWSREDSCHRPTARWSECREDPSDDDDDDDDEEPILSLSASLAWLVIATIILAYLSELLSASVEMAAVQLGLNKAFVGFVIIPIIGNAAEHSTAVVMARRLKMDLALSVAQGSSTQIALFVVPVMVLLGWAIGQPLDLMFGTFETVITSL